MGLCDGIIDGSPTNNTVTATWNGRHGISNYMPIECLLNTLFKLKDKETSKVRIIVPLWGESAAEWWIPHTKAR